MKLKTVAIAALVSVALAACGTKPTDRAISGSALGAGAGAVIGAVAGGPILGAAIIGGAAGALAGAVTNPNMINLGNPPWAN